jgi:hypothetical protein
VALRVLCARIGANKAVYAQSGGQQMIAAAQPAKNSQVKYLEAIQTETRVLADKLKSSDDPEAIFYGLQLDECVSDENLFVGIGMTSKDGEVFTGRGNLVGTSSRLDRFYLKKQARIGRENIADYLSKVKLRPDERWRFLTLTMPKIKGREFEVVMFIFDAACKKLRDSAFWKKTVRAGVKSKEFTLGDEWIRQSRKWTLDDDGFHIHGHFILAAKWIENRKVNGVTGEKYYRELAEEWKKALVKSAKRYGVVLEFNTEDGLPIVDVRLIKNKGVISEGEISLKDAIAETAKYITKQSALEHLPVDQIMSVNRYLKGKRMIEPLGEANQRKGKGTPKNDVLEPVSDNPNQESISFCKPDTEATDTSVLQEKTIESFSRLKTECLRLIEHGEIAEAGARIGRRFERLRAFRRRQLTWIYPTAEFMTLSGEVFTSEDYETGNFREKQFNVR